MGILPLDWVNGMNFENWENGEWEMNELAGFALHSSPFHSFSPGCSSEPGYFAAGDSLPGYAAISVGSPEDCAIKCARVEGCAAWTFALQNEDK